MIKVNDVFGNFEIDGGVKIEDDQPHKHLCMLCGCFIEYSNSRCQAAHDHKSGFCDKCKETLN